MSTNSKAIRSAELGTNDHTPECPDCRNLNHPGSTVCADCGTHLLVGASFRKQRPKPAPGEAVLVCPTCLRRCADAYCDGCGAGLTVTARLAAGERATRDEGSL